jgi:hypothetical protein
VEKTRKGTSWGQDLSLFGKAFDLEHDSNLPLFQEALGRWREKCITGGLSSGEGLIWSVRDKIIKRERVKKDGVVTYEEVEADPGISDKRLLVFEAELANVLKQLERQGNTLSVTVRQAWDTGRLNTMTKNNPAAATGAHVSIVAHTTVEELKRYLSATEAANGFANRFMLICAKRSKSLPKGGEPDATALTAVQEKVYGAVLAARGVGEMARSEEAESLWCEVYGPLSEGLPGLVGALLGRAEAHVLRLSMLYALLDRSAVITRTHLEAALACWRFVEESTKHVFGDATGDTLADELLRLLRSCPGGLSRNDLTNYLSRHQPSNRIGQALGLLLQHRLARCEYRQTGGRQAEWWFAETGKR